jgi:tight adherence protein B
MTDALFHSAWGPTALAISVGSITLVAALVALARPRGAWLRSRLDPYGRLQTVGSGAPVDSSPGWRPQAERLYGVTERVFEKTRAWQAAMRLLERANSRMRPAELMYGSLLAGVGLATLMAIFNRSVMLVTLVGIVGASLPSVWLSARARRRMNAFDEQLADVLMTMAAALKVGQSFTHSMGAIVNDGMAPASEEFERVLYESQLGRPVDDALAAMADRIRSEDMRFVLMSVAIQREVGGSLAELFQTISDTVRERQNFRRKVKALTAMGRMSAYFLFALPFFVAAIVSLTSPSYLSPLFNTGVGHFLIVLMFVMMAMGAFVLKKIVSIKG